MSAAGGLDVSLAIPCYNEAGHLEQTVAELIEVLEGTRWSYEVLFVDDGSTDGTRTLLPRLCERYPRCRFLLHEKNRGRGAAFKTGFANTTGRVTGFIDIDLEVHARYIPALVAAIEQHGFDVATGLRHYLLSQTGGLHRELMSVVYRWLCRRLLGLGVKDSETGCKFFRRETASAVVLGSQCDGWFWDTEVMSRSVLAGLRITELPVLFLRKMDKESTVRLVHDSLGYLRELFAFRRHLGLSRGGSPIYRSTWLYDLVMWSLYRGGYGEVLAGVAARIPAGASVVDLCGGHGRLFFDHLQAKGCRYLCLDSNVTFVMAARNRGADARLFDVRNDEIPAADYVVMCSSLYHFHGDAPGLLARMRAAARRGVIVSEPVSNLSAHPLRALGGLANRLTDPGRGDFSFRYDQASLSALAEGVGARVERALGSRNALLITEGGLAASEAVAPATRDAQLTA